MTFHYLKNGETLRLDSALCNGCGRCIEVCPHGVLLPEDHHVTIGDRAACMECGACARNCARAAITVTAGVGCASAVIAGLVRGTEPTCGCGGQADAGGCGTTKSCC